MTVKSKSQLEIDIPIGVGAGVSSQDIRDLLDSLYGAVETYVPTLTASVTSPTLGTGSVQEGFFIRTGNKIDCWGRIGFGTSGVDAGSGTYIVSLPVAATDLTAATGFNLGQIVGSCSIRDDSGGLGGNLVGSAQLRTASALSFNISANRIGHDVPGWAASDFLGWAVAYIAEVA